MKVIYLTLEEILRLHFQLIEDFGGSHGVRDEGRLHSIVKAPSQEVFGSEQYPSLFEKTAVYFRNIAGDHLFVDGNKRTAVTVCGIFLLRNGRRLKADPIELEKFTLDTVTKHYSVTKIAKWLEENSD